jgi:hypothetical protein
MIVQTYESKGEAWSRHYATCRPSPRRTRRVIVVHKTTPPKHLESLDCLSRVGTVVLTLLLTLFSCTGCWVQSKLSDCRHTGACRARRPCRLQAPRSMLSSGPAVDRPIFCGCGDGQAAARSMCMPLISWPCKQSAVYAADQFPASGDIIATASSCRFRSAHFAHLQSYLK